MTDHDSVTLTPAMGSPTTPGVPWFALRCSCGQSIGARPIDGVPERWAAHIAEAEREAERRATAALVHTTGRRRRRPA